MVAPEGGHLLGSPSLGEVDRMPNITVELFTGRTLEQKRAYVAAVTRSTVEILKVKPEAVRIRLVEMETWDLANGGNLESDLRGTVVPAKIIDPKG
jgi:4-oxalocrotonate tautomerase